MVEDGDVPRSYRRLGHRAPDRQRDQRSPIEITSSVRVGTGDPGLSSDHLPGACKIRAEQARQKLAGRKTCAPGLTEQFMEVMLHKVFFFPAQERFPCARR